MFAMGLVGFLAGLFFSKSGVRTKNTTKLGLCIFGALICILIYGGIMNPGVGDNLAAGCEQEHDHSVICDGIPI